MPLVEIDHRWECKREEVYVVGDEFRGNVDESKSLMIKLCMHPGSSYRKEWWYADSEGHNNLLYKIDEAVGVSGNNNNCVEIDAGDMLSTPTPAALITLITEKLLISLEPAASEDTLKELASDLISDCRQLISSTTAISNNKCSFLMISIYVRYNVFIYLYDTDIEEIEQYKWNLPLHYLTLLKPLPILINDGTANNPFKLCEDESCAVCLEGYLEGCRVVRMQCSYEVEEYEYFGGSDSDIIWMPCSHKFHANCITKCLKITNSCPLCRFHMPSCATLFAILADFDFQAHSEA